MAKTHTYEVALTWTGNTGTGTSGYGAFERSVDASAEGKPVIPGSADPAYRGARDRWSPEELLVVSLSQCHMLWYLVLCAKDRHRRDGLHRPCVGDAHRGLRMAAVISRR